MSEWIGRRYFRWDDGWVGDDCPILYCTNDQVIGEYDYTSYFPGEHSPRYRMQLDCLENWVWNERAFIEWVDVWE